MHPSKIINVSSAYCEILYSTIPIIIPFVSLFLMKIPKISHFTERGAVKLDLPVYIIVEGSITKKLYHFGKHMIIYHYKMSESMS